MRGFDNDQKYANEQMKILLAAIANKEADTVKSLFSQNVVSNVENIDESIERLFEYYKGTAPVWDERCPQVVEGENGEGEKVFVSSSYDVKNSEDYYRISFRACRIDRADPDNVGIWSLYIILLKDDPNPRQVYWGDGKDILGINIGVVGE